MNISATSKKKAEKKFKEVTTGEIISTTLVGIE